MTYGTIGTDKLVGSSGGTLSPDSGVFRNRIINGAMVIDQRNAGASITNINGTVYTLDRWAIAGAQASKFTAQQSTTVPNSGFKNSLSITSSSAYTVGASESFTIRQAIEGFNVADLNWGTSYASTVTLSFWVRSSLTGTFGGSLINNGFDRSYPFSYTINSANTWEQKSITIAGDQTGTWATDNNAGIRVMFGLGAGSSQSATAGTWATGNYQSATGATSVVGTNGATFYITGVQLEKGSTATSFDYRPYGTELQLCQRYFQTYNGSGGGLQLFGRANAPSSGVSFSIWMTAYPVQFRASPTVSFFGTWNTSNATQPATNGGTASCPAITFNSSGSGDCYCYVNSASMGFTATAEL